MSALHWLLVGNVKGACVLSYRLIILCTCVNVSRKEVSCFRDFRLHLFVATATNVESNTTRITGELTFMQLWLPPRTNNSNNHKNLSDSFCYSKTVKNNCKLSFCASGRRIIGHEHIICFYGSLKSTIPGNEWPSVTVCDRSMTPDSVPWGASLWIPRPLLPESRDQEKFFKLIKPFLWIIFIRIISTFCGSRKKIILIHYH